jgi:hypothetical protein
MEAKATLEFNLPEQEHDFKYACAGLDALLVLDKLDEELRSVIRYKSGELASFYTDEGKKQESCVDTIEAVRKKLWEIRDDYKLPDLI